MCVLLNECHISVLPSVVEVGGTQGCVWIPMALFRRSNPTCSVKPIDAVDPPRLHSAHCSESLRKIAKPHRCSTPQPSNHLRNPPDFCFPRSVSVCCPIPRERRCVQYIGFLHVDALILSVSMFVLQRHLFATPSGFCVRRFCELTCHLSSLLITRGSFVRSALQRLGSTRDAWEISWIHSGVR